MSVKRQARGIKRSSVMKVQRQLTLLRLLSLGPATADELIERVNEKMLDAYPRAAKAAFRHDLRALRDVFGCVVEYRSGRGYELVSVGDLGITNLSDDEINAIRFLDSTYTSNSTIPEQQQVRRLLDRIIDQLPPERRGRLNAAEPVLQLAGPHNPHPHDAITLRAIRRAINLRRELRFRYRASLRPNEETHRVAPINLFTRDSHLYLLAYCYDGPMEMPERVGGYVDYRVDYIVKGSAEVLPRTLPRSLPSRPTWNVKYELSPEVARNRRIAHWFADTEVEYRDDGSAIVTAKIHNLWQARQILLRYVENCLVLEPQELVDMMRTSAARLCERYRV